MVRTSQARTPASPLALLGCLGLGLVSGLAAEIRVVGSDLLGPDFARALAGCARQNGSGLRLDLQGTRPGVEELAAGRADLGLFLLPPGENPPGGALASRVIGYQVAVVAVPAVSPLTEVTVARLRGIFGATSGDAYSRWGELNLTGTWRTRPIALCALAPSAGLAWPLFQQCILGGSAGRPALEFAATPEAFLQRLLASDNGIGVTGLPPAAVPAVRLLALAAGPGEPACGPTPEQVHRGGYPLRLPLYVTFRRGAAPVLQPFLKFLLSDAAAAALAPAFVVLLPPGDRHLLELELEVLR